MTKKILTKRKTNYNPNSASNDYNTGIKFISRHWRKPTQRVLLFLQNNQPKKPYYSLEELGAIMKVSHSAVGTNYLRDSEEESNG